MSTIEQNHFYFENKNNLYSDCNNFACKKFNFKFF